MRGISDQQSDCQFLKKTAPRSWLICSSNNMTVRKETIDFRLADPVTYVNYSVILRLYINYLRHVLSNEMQ